MRDIYYSLLGDIALTGIISTQPELNIKRFKDVIPILGESDIVFGNLEVPLKVDDSANEYKNLIHFSLLEPTRYLLKLLNIGCVSLANNHIYDCKMSGLKATIELLDELGIYHTGAGWKKEHTEPVIIEKHGYKIGFIAYVDKSTNPGTENYSELFINYLDLELVKQHIHKLKSKVDKVICSLHWGVDYSNYPTLKQIEIGQELIKAGAEIIMGHHPHTLQPFAKYNDDYVFYSLGTLIFGDIKRKNRLSSLPVKTKKGVIIQYEPFNNRVNFVGTKIHKYGYIRINKFDYEKWTSKIMSVNRMRLKFSFINYIIYFKESFLDKLREVFFGYYRNPIKLIFSRKFPKGIYKTFLEAHKALKID